MPSVQQALFWLVSLLCLVCRAAPPLLTGTASPRFAVRHEQQHLRPQPGRKLHGRFLHISDIHPDPFYKTYSSTAADAACHRHKGPAGLYGAETSGCDSPISLVNETFKWIEENLKDNIDFVIWTGDSARHDNDDTIPRTREQIIQQNEFIVSKFTEVFGKDSNPDQHRPTNALTIPIVPSFGNNDIMPHNIFLPGPNRWTMRYLDIWRYLIPEEQRHQFHRGGWFFVEVIPQKLAVVSLNTIYFFASNSGVDGCAAKGEPGYEHLDWLRIQLRVFRERGMKVILMGHVPPARTDSKLSWDETCWQKYTLWQRQYRDIIVASFFGHMNIDHFMLQDFADLKKDTKNGRMEVSSQMLAQFGRTSMYEDGEVTVSSASDYLLDLRNSWAKLPMRVDINSEDTSMDVGNENSFWGWVFNKLPLGQLRISKSKKGNHGRSPDKEFLHQIGGKWGERFSVALVSPSVVPTYFPTLRVFEYNITGLEEMVMPDGNVSYVESTHLSTIADEGDLEPATTHNNEDSSKNKKKKGRKPHKKPKKHKFKVPDAPSKSAPPGPAYSPQTLSLIGYAQFFANLTHINNDFVKESEAFPDSSLLNATGWKEGKHKGKEAKHKKPHPKKFKYQLEYNTTDDKIYKLNDLTVLSYLELATKIGSGRKAGVAEPRSELDFSSSEDGATMTGQGSSADAHDMGKKDGKKKKKHGTHRRHKNDVWFHFVKRAFVGTMDSDDIEDEFYRHKALEEAAVYEEVLEL